jgi:hypothetical protein
LAKLWVVVLTDCTVAYGRIQRLLAAATSAVRKRPPQERRCVSLINDKIIDCQYRRVLTRRSLDFAHNAQATITNAVAITGNPTFALANDLATIGSSERVLVFTLLGAVTWNTHCLIPGTSVVSLLPMAMVFLVLLRLDLTAGAVLRLGTFGSVAVDTYGRVIAGSASVNAIALTMQVITNSNGATCQCGQVIYTDAGGKTGSC